MNINLTLIVQMIVFFALVWFTMKFVWPMILGADGGALAARSRRAWRPPRRVSRRSPQAREQRRCHRARGARARQPDHRPGAAPRQRAGRPGQGDRQQPKGSAHRGRGAAADRARGRSAQREPAHAKWPAIAVKAAVEAARARDRRAHACRPAQTSSRRRSDAHGRPPHHRTALRPRRVRGARGEPSCLAALVAMRCTSPPQSCRTRGSQLSSATRT